MYEQQSKGYILLKTIIIYFQESPPQAEEGRCKSQKKPRRVLHFSDGVMEEYSTDEEEEEEKKKLNPDPMPVADPVSTHW